MTAEKKEFILFRTLFVVVATLIAAAIGGLFMWQWAIVFGLVQFVLVLLLTRERVALTERNPVSEFVSTLTV